MKFCAGKTRSKKKKKNQKFFSVLLYFYFLFTTKVSATFRLTKYQSYIGFTTWSNAKINIGEMKTHRFFRPMFPLTLINRRINDDTVYLRFEYDQTRNLRTRDILRWLRKCRKVSLSTVNFLIAYHMDNSLKPWDTTRNIVWVIRMQIALALIPQMRFVFSRMRQ